VQIEQVATADLIPYARNARTHSESQVAQIAGSIQEFGFTNPVLIDAANGIIAGHGRVMAAQKLGLQSVPCIRLGYLTDAQKRAYILADNRIALNSGWDDAMLEVELAELHADEYDLGLLGFDADEVSKLMGYSPNFAPGTEEEQGRLDEKAKITCPECKHEFTP
jgi:ParB-like chromosome segregation protein Spo0J